MTDLAAICKSASEICIDVGSYILEERKSFAKHSVEYKSANDLVSYVDKMAELQLVERLEKLIPGSGFICEEGTSEKKSDTLPPACFRIKDPPATSQAFKPYSKNPSSRPQAT